MALAARVFAVSSPISPSSLVCSSNKISRVHLESGDPYLHFLSISNICSPSLRSTSCRLNFSPNRNAQRRRSKLESIFHYDKPIPEEFIEKPIGLSVDAKNIGNNSCCVDCQAKGVVLCPTCSGTGLYIDSILESQGIIVKVRCLGCGGIGNMMCSGCWGRGHL